MSQIDPIASYKALDEAQLIDQLLSWDKAYYNGSGQITDALYDAVRDYAKLVYPGNPYFAKTGAAAAQGAGGTWTLVRHPVFMCSLEKCKPTLVDDPSDPTKKVIQNSEMLAAWYQSSRLTNTTRLIVMLKLDGSSISLVYENRELVRAATRGDGAEGFDITPNVKLMRGAVKKLPATLPDGTPTPQRVFVRAEIICTLTNFKKHFPGAVNPRGTANGTAKRQSDAGACAHLDLIAYDFMPDCQPMATKEQELTALAKAGFQVVEHFGATGLAGIEAIYKSFVDGKRAALDLEIDGLVATIDDAKVREGLGVGSDNRPNGARAYKFPSAEGETTLRNIKWQIGNSGRITPVAEFDPIVLAGATITFASLHNLDQIEEMWGKSIYPAVGDRITVSRRNDVIPCVEGVVLRHGQGKALVEPTVCSSCGTKLVRDGAYLVCRGEECDAQVRGSVIRWVKKIGILYVGDSLIDTLVETGTIEDCADLYTMDVSQVEDLEIGGRKVGGSAAKAINNLNAKKALPLHVIVGSIGIPLIGRSMAKLIVDAGFDSLSKMLKAKVADVAAIPGVGSVRAESFVKGFMAKAGLIAKLIGNGITVQTVAGPLLGKSFCLTGFRDQMLQDAIEKAGGTMKSGVSKGLTYLIAAPGAGSTGKASKAASYGTKVIDAAAAWAMVGGKV